MIVDVHAHVIVPGLGADVRREAGRQIVSFGGREIRSATREFVSVDAILEEQDRAGVDQIVLCPWVQLLGREPEKQNEALANLVSSRVACLGTVSLDEPDELVTLMRDGRLSGVEVAASFDGEYLGAERFRPFWSAAEETGAVVFVHPTTRGFQAPIFDQHYLSNTIGNPLETTITAAHMILQGVMDDHPSLKVILAHGGGAVTALRGRLAHHQGFAAPGRDVMAALRRFYYDTVVFDPGVLLALVDFASADHVLLGSDYPFDMGDSDPAGVVRSAGLRATDEAAILGGNARRLLGQDVA
ncbi:MAG TPA: amidohydrolase family protein [Gaiellaceae bacterium]|nr:amidohydrolase family protein [Gaiellaceae bacterium]